jgi:hypothetical protein
LGGGADEAMTKLSERLNNDGFGLYMGQLALAELEGVLNSDEDLLAYYREKSSALTGTKDSKK